MKKNNNTELKDFFEDENKTINAETMFHKNMKVYGLDVLEDRALADYRDGLKPAQRRLMWTAKELKATWENKTVKSARITGDCFTGDTEILTVNNEKLPIAKLEKMIEHGENVYTFSSSETGEIEVSKVVKCWKKTETDNLVKVYLDNDTYFECTPDHKIMLRDGTYQKAIELKENTSLMPLYFSDNTLDGRRQIIDNKIGKTISVYKLAGKHKDCDMSELLNEGDYFQIHHVDFNKLNDRPDNLKRINNKNHARLHGSISLHNFNTNGGLSNRNIKSWKDKEYRKYMIGKIVQSNIKRGEKHNEEIISKVKTIINKNDSLYNAYCKLNMDEFNCVVINSDHFEHYKFITDIPYLTYCANDKTGNSFKTVMYILSLHDNDSILNRETLLLFKKKHKSTFIGSAKFISKNFSELISELNIKIELPEEIDYPEEIRGNSRKIQLYNSGYRIIKTIKENGELLNEENWNKYIRNNNELTYKTATSKQVYSQLFANYNHKVLKVEKLKLNEKVAVYNVEVDSKYHNFPLGNGVFVKNCMGKYHPHSSSYGSLGTLVDCEYPLVYGQGNWGSLTDGAAAERYTEAKISQLGMKMLECMDVADYVPNYTGEFKEPIVLTTRVPNFFINECAGIAVGLSCNIPAHNLKEVVEAMKVVVKKGEATKLKDIMKYLKGPDYKYGGKIISTQQEIESLYKNGEGAIKYECDYTLTREKKNMLLTVTGFCPGFSPESFINKMISLIDEKVVIYVNDSSTKDEPCKLEVLLSNEEDFEKKIHKHLIKSVSYRYYAIEREKSNDVEKDVDTKVIMPNLVELMNMWVNWRKNVETKMCEVEKKLTEEKKQKLDWRLLASQNLKVVVKGLEDKDPIKYIAENMPGLKGKTFATEAAKYICDQRVISLQKVDQDKIKNEIQDNVTHIKELEHDIANIDDVVIRELDKLKPFYRDRKLKV